MECSFEEQFGRTLACCSVRHCLTGQQEVVQSLPHWSAVTSLVVVQQLLSKASLNSLHRPFGNPLGFRMVWRVVRVLDAISIEEVLELLRLKLCIIIRNQLFRESVSSKYTPQVLDSLHRSS